MKDVGEYETGTVFFDIPTLLHEHPLFQECRKDQQRCKWFEVRGGLLIAIRMLQQKESESLA